MSKEFIEILESTGIPEAIKMLREFIDKIFGPASGEVGFFLQDVVRDYRLRNQLKIFARSKEILEKSGIEPSAIPLRTLIPLLEGASLENDGNLSEKWSSLLANASILDSEIIIHPSYSRTLSDLSPIDALILDELALFDKPEKKDSFERLIMEKFKISKNQYTQHYWNLNRLGLCYYSQQKNSTHSNISLSPYGKQFHQACSDPN